MLGNRKIWGVGLLVTLLIGCSLPISQANDTYKFIVKDIKIIPAEANIGDTITIVVNLSNPTNATITDKIELVINSAVVDYKNVTLIPYETKQIYFVREAIKEGIYVVIVGNVTATYRIISNQTEYPEKKFRVGPVVRLRPLLDEMKVHDENNLIELFFSNPALNDVDLNVEVWVSVPANFHIWGEGFSFSSGAGTVYGSFTVQPGGSRTIYLHAKASKEGDYSVHFSGIYYPDDNKDDYYPISLTHPIKVVNSIDGTSAINSVINFIQQHPWIILVIIIAIIAIIMLFRTVVIIEK